jgi:pimeloyl-ACP methyl ester carboxylesterase
VNRRSRHSLCFILCSMLTVPALAQDTTARAGQAVADLQKLDGMLEFLRRRNAQDYAITTPNGIDESRYVTVGGIEQYITIRGEDRSNPVILFLHGGPGDATNPWGYAAFRTWLRHYTVVQWDQRGTGRTLGRSGPSIAPTITIERMVDDGIELAGSLRTTLNVEKVILVGHSWGSTLGVFMAKKRPDLFHAFVGTGQVVDPARNYPVAYADVLKAAESRRDERAIMELREVGPPPWTDRRGYNVQRKWANLYEGADLFLASTFGMGLAAPGSTPRDVTDWFEGQGVSGSRLVPLTSALEARAIGGDFALPVFVIQGAEDFTTPTSLAREFVRTIRAPRKAFTLLAGGGHFAVFMESDAFLKALMTHIEPIVHRR